MLGIRWYATFWSFCYFLGRFFSCFLFSRCRYPIECFVCREVIANTFFRGSKLWGQDVGVSEVGEGGMG